MSNGIKRMAFIICAMGLCGLALVFGSLNVNQVDTSKLANFDVIETFKNGNVTFSGDNGTYGYANSNGEVILRPNWNYILPIAQDRFIVSRTGNNCKGIITSDETVISPFIYQRFEELSKNILVGYTYDNQKLFLLNQNGNRYANEEWDKIDYKSDDDFILTQGKSQYFCKISDNKLIINNVVLVKNVLGKDISVSFVPNETLPEIQFKTYEKISDATIDSVIALINNDTENLKNMCTEKFYKNHSRNNQYKKSKMIEFIYINPQIDINEDNSLLYHSTIRISYDNGNGATDGTNIQSQEMYIYFKMDENGRLLVLNIEA